MTTHEQYIEHQRDMAHRDERELMDAVAEALANALENGHDFKGWTDEAIADDMIECGGMPDDTPRVDLIYAIRALRS